MAGKLLPDDIWKAVHPLIPRRPRRLRGGRPPVDDRDVLTGIVFVLKTGIAWEDLPGEMGCGCGMTCLRRLREWRQAGIWPRIQHVLAARLPHAHRIDWGRTEIRLRDKSSKQHQRHRDGLTLVPHGHAESHGTGQSRTDFIECASAGGSHMDQCSFFVTDGAGSGLAT